MKHSGVVAVGPAGVGAWSPPEGVKTIVFDVVGTLIQPWPVVARAYQHAAARHGIERDPDTIRTRFAAAWRRQEQLDAAATPAFATNRGREAERWRAIVEDVFDGVPASGTIFADLWDHFGRVEAWQPMLLGCSLMQRARESGMKLALASNFDERLLGIAGAIEPLSWADHVFTSSEIGWRKPAPEFFRVVEERLGCEPSELLLVGDDPELDIAAGQRAGWHVLGVMEDPVPTG